MAILDKSNFLNYLICERYGWNIFRKKLTTDFEDSQRQYRAQQGIEVEHLCQKLFPDGWEISGDRQKAARQTHDLIEQRRAKVLYQATAISDDQLLAKADITLVQADGSLDLYEVKMVNNLELDKTNKSPSKEKHLDDITFQKIAFSRSGYHIGRVFLVHINSNYRLLEAIINPEHFFKQVDVSQEVAENEAKIKAQIEEAQVCYAKTAEPKCLCRFKTKARRCETFLQFNPEIPTKNSIFDISRIKAPKLELLMEKDIWKIQDIADELVPELNFSTTQLNQIEVLRSKQPIVDKEAIAAILKEVEYPLYFLDYETINYPIPVFKGSRPFQQVAFQFSLHILKNKTAPAEHHEYLMQEASEDELCKLAAALQASIDSQGSIVVWHQAAEKGFHQSLIHLLPDLAPFFNNLNQRIFDLEKVFSAQHYVHPALEGRTSLKNAVHILKSDYYDDLAIQQGGLASVAWSEALESSAPEKEKRFEQLLQYCQRDTWAMVEIYQHLHQLIAQ